MANQKLDILIDKPYFSLQSYFHFCLVHCVLMTPVVQAIQAIQALYSSVGYFSSEGLVFHLLH